MNLVAILKELDYSPLYISLKTGVVATILSFFLGIFAAKRSMSAGKRMRAVLDGILTLPMVLPPTAAGFFLLLLFSRRRPVGMFLYEKLDIKILILYILRRLPGTVDPETLAELCQCDSGVGYFDYSDIYGYEDQVEVLQKVPYDLTGVVNYPVCLVKNDEADEAQSEASRDFYEFLLSDEAKEVYENYYFDTDVE